MKFADTSRQWQAAKAVFRKKKRAGVNRRVLESASNHFCVAGCGVGAGCEPVLCPPRSTTTRALK
jgi:hypothetical protein